MKFYVLKSEFGSFNASILTLIDVLKRGIFDDLFCLGQFSCVDVAQQHYDYLIFDCEV